MRVYAPRMKTTHYLTLSRLVLSLTLALSGAAFAENAALDKQLTQAVQFQDITETRALLAKGANANAREGGRPLLGWAAQSGELGIVDALLQAGANPNVADEGIGHTPLMRAIDTQQSAIVRALLKAKADPNAKASNGRSCLMMAAASRKPEIVAALIEAGVNVKEVDAEGNSPALIAAQEGSPESLQILRALGKAGANMNASNAAETPLLYAITQENAELVRTLLESGASPSAPASGDHFPLERALHTPALLILLLAAKADPNMDLGDGETALYQAIQEGSVDAVKLLLEAGANSTTPLKNGSTPREYAEQNGYTEIAALFAPQAAASAPQEYPVYSLDPVTSNGTTCSIADAARRQMEIHELLQKQVDAGKMDSDIFRTFGEDTKEFGRLLTENPAEACRLLEKLRTKYGV